MIESADLPFVDVTLTPLAVAPWKFSILRWQVGASSIPTDGSREAERRTRSDAASHQNRIGPWLSGVARRTRQSRAELRTRSATRARTHIFGQDVRCARRDVCAHPNQECKAVLLCQLLFVALQERLTRDQSSAGTASSRLSSSAESIPIRFSPVAPPGVLWRSIDRRRWQRGSKGYGPTTGFTYAWVVSSRAGSASRIIARAYKLPFPAFESFKATRLRSRANLRSRSRSAVDGYAISVSQDPLRNITNLALFSI
jgi:hypothetical protein